MTRTIQLVRESDAARAERTLELLLARPAQQGDRFEQEPEVQSYLAETVVEQANALGLATEQDPMGSVIVRVGPTDAARRVALFAYAMSHPAGRMVGAHEPTPIIGPDGRRRLRGRGAAEQKGALASALLAMASLRAREGELGGGVDLCVSPAGETGRHDAVRVFLDAASEPTYDWSIVSIGTNSQICVANKGRIDATITVRGRSAHSGTPWAGLNAITGTVEVLRRLGDLELGGEHPQLGRATLTPTAVHSFPPATHTVPDEVRIVIDRRLLPGDLPDPALDEIRTALDGMAPYEVEVSPGPFMYPSEVGTDSDLVRLLEAAFEAAGHPDPGLRYSHGAIDAGYFNRHGIAAVMLGPGEQELWHTDDESVAIEDVLLCASVYATAAFNHLAGWDGR